MPRPSRQTDQRLIQAAQQLMQRSGLSRLNLRQVAAKAGVNLGMFHYHFKGKEQFIQAVLEHTYEQFFQNFSLRVEGKTEPLEKLRQALVAMAQFSRDNRQVVLSLMQDALNQEPGARAFAQRSMGRHAQVILGLIAQCQRQGTLPKAPLPMLMSYVMTASTGSSLVLGLMEHAGAGKPHLEFFKASAFTDAALARRVDWVLGGLAADLPRPRPSKKKGP
ncbi:MAG TPA: TetR/AcrR family transcriptional regulator [bacterium]|nr:TetR/AcrR family transcriptional regulator [bacterium]